MRSNAGISARPLELQDLEVFALTAGLGAIRRAAAAIGVEPSAVSRRIRALEDRLGVSLFERERSGLRLTVAGDRFLHDVRNALAQIDHATRSVREAGTGANGAINLGIIGGLASHLLSKILMRYRREHPDVRLELVEGTTESHVEAVSTRALDAAFILGTHERQDQNVAPILSEALFAGVQATDFRASTSPLPIEAFAQDTFLVSAYAQGRDVEDFLTRELSQAGHSPLLSHHRVGREALMLMVGLGFGVALCCESETRVDYPNVAFVRLQGKAVRISIVWSPGHDNPALRRFVSLARRMSGQDEGSAVFGRTPDPPA